MKDSDRVITSDHRFKYWAFISYSSKDAAIASRLHRWLETYRVPRGLVGRPGQDEAVPSKLFPIFRDRDELPMSSDLGGTIQDALRASRYLIVVCSPNAEGSKWVNEEIRYFKSLGRDSRILAVIVDGIPNGSDTPATAAQECFPRALRYRLLPDGQLSHDRTEPIAGDLRRGGDGQTAVLLKAVAGITGMGYDAFAKREAKRAFRRRIGYAVAAFLLLLAGLGYWDYSRLKVHYYGAVVERWGVPVGHAPLKAWQQSAREISYRFESRGYKVRRVDRINGAGLLSDDGETSAARTDVLYREDGSLERLRLVNHNGKLVLQKSFSKPGQPDDMGLRPITIAFLSKSEFAQSLVANIGSAGGGGAPSGNDIPKRSDITAYQAFYNADGRLSSVYFRNSYGSPVADVNGVYGQKYEYNEHGQIVKVSTVDAEGESMPDRRGVLSVGKSYGTLGSMIRQNYVGHDGQPTLGPDQVAVDVFKTDDYGRWVERRCFDAQNQPTLHKDGYARVEWTYLPTGIETGGRYYDLEDRPTLIRDGYAAYVNEPTEQRWVARMTYLGVDGKPVLNKLGFASWAAKTDSSGNYLGFAYYDTAGSPAMTTGGLSRTEIQLDNRGNQTEVRSFDTDGRPVLVKQGFACVRMVYDDWDHCLSRQYFDQNGEPCITSEGIAQMLSKYDERGNCVGEQYLGVDGSPILTQSGVSGIADRLDEHGNLVERRYLGIKEELVSHRDGYARFSQIFDDHGNMIEQAYFDTADQPTLCKQGFARRRSVFDANGFEKRRDFFGTDGRPILDSMGRARIVYVNDAFGHHTEERIFDTNYLPVANSSGVSIARVERNRRGDVTSMRTFDARGMPVLAQEQMARIDMEYDNRGNKISISHYGIAGEPVMAGGDKIARRTRRYDKRNNVIEERCFGIDGQPCRSEDGFSWMVSYYDSRDNVTKKTTFGIDDKPCPMRSGIATVETAYDALSRKSGESYFGRDGRPVLDSEGVARIENSYDSLGNMTGQRYFGVDGKPTTGKLGFTRSEIAYDTAGRAVQYKYFGIDGKPTSGPEGFALQKVRYDAAGRLLEAEHFDTANRPCNAAEGWSHMIRHYDRNGRILEETLFGPDGAPIRGKGHYARMTTRYTDSGDVKEQTYFDELGELTLSSEGVAKTEYRYDAMGRHIETSTFGIDGQLRNSRNRFARIVKKRDQLGRLVEQSTFGADDRLIVSAEGYARKVWQFDQSGNITDETNFGPEGLPMASRLSGVWRATCSYNAAGLVTLKRRFGQDGERLQSDEHCYEERTTYHANGVIAEFQGFLLKPGAIPNVAGIKASSWNLVKYDASGVALSKDVFNYYPPGERGAGRAVLAHQIYSSGNILIGCENLDEHGHLANGPGGYARDVIEIDQFGRPWRGTAYDESGKRSSTINFAGVDYPGSRIDMHYDEFGRVAEYLCFDIDDQPLARVDVPFRMTHEFGIRDQPTLETKYYRLPQGTKRLAVGSPPVRTINRMNASGKTLETTTYREVSGRAETRDLVYSVTRVVPPGHPVEVKYEDVEQKPMTGPDGYHRVEQKFDRRNYLLRSRYYGVDNKPLIHTRLGVAGYDYQRDRNGKELEIKRIGTDGELLPDSEGTAITRRHWDSKGRVTEEAYFDRDGLPNLRSTVGFAILRTTYDDTSSTSEQRYFDKSGAATKSAADTFVKRTTVDTQGRPVEERFFTLEGTPARAINGVAGVLKKYGAGQKPVEVVTIDEEGRPLRSTLGYARVSFELDANGNILIEEYFDEEGRPAPANPQNRCRRVETRYNAANRPEARTLFYSFPELPTGPKGYAKVVETLDAHGRAIEGRYFDAENNPVMSVDGYAVLRLAYDGKGNVVEESFFDVSEAPCLSNENWHRSVRRYDGDKMVMHGFFDLQGQPAVSSTLGFAFFERTGTTDSGRPSWRIVDASGEEADCEVVIAQIVPGSQAAEIGLMPDDVIVSYDGVAVRHMLQVIELTQFGESTERPVEILRAGSSLTVRVSRGRLGAALKVRPVGAAPPAAR